MKCIKQKIDGSISRLKDDKAAILVNIGTHNYVSKSVWKRDIAKVKTEVVTEAEVVTETEVVTEVKAKKAKKSVKKAKK